jgi:hypothetical protein
MRSYFFLVKFVFKFISIHFFFFFYPRYCALNITRRKLFEGHTFRVVGANANIDRLAPLRYFKRAMFKIFHFGKSRVKVSDAIILCQVQSQRSEFLPYIEQITKVSINEIIYRDDFNFSISFLWKITLCFFTVLIFPYFLFFSFFVRNRSAFSLQILQFVENSMLAFVLIRMRAKQVFYFGGYENDQCLTGIICTDLGIELTLIPSANPISNFYKEVIASKFIFTAEFQKIEYEKLKSGWIVKGFEKWPIINSISLKDRINSGTKEFRFDIGFMSRGVWLRKRRQHNAINDCSDYIFEERCLEILKNFLLDRSDLTFLVLLHPIERKSEELLIESKKYYQDYFSDVNVNFIEYQSGMSSSYFADVNLTLASISSVNIERLFCGYKTLYAPIGAEHEFFSGSSLDNIVARTPEKLMDLLNRSVTMTDDEFFQSFDLEAYRHGKN